jgi:hypothetical protein
MTDSSRYGRFSGPFSSKNAFQLLSLIDKHVFKDAANTY